MSSIPIKITLLITLAVTLVFASMALAQGHVMLTSAEIQWGEAPPMVPPGAKMAVLSGNPAGDSLYTVRVKMPANYRIPAHSHPKDEHVMVLSGSLSMGAGGRFRRTQPPLHPAPGITVLEALVDVGGPRYLQ